MKERPILFSGAMVRAILAGRKTQTRRVVNGEISPCAYAPGKHALNGQVIEGNLAVLASCPYGRPGDRLWVRETWAPHADEEETFRNYQRKEMGCSKPEIFYRADGGDPHVNNWRPSIHMPRWASRLTLEVTEVRVQRLQEISEEDARAEGVEAAPFCKAGRPNGMEHVEAFEGLWTAINGERPGCSWQDNPWVWCVSFRRAE